jgi:hypothetical protein
MNCSECTRGLRNILIRSSHHSEAYNSLKAIHGSVRRLSTFRSSSASAQVHPDSTMGAQVV